jgi:D-alanyl-lipoteichoic acid acyltransferase DltB (MBOAT superfamily)
MLFNSIQFLIFFPAVTALYFGLPHRLRWAWLLAASCYFYMAFMPSYILILGFTIVIDYFAGLAIENAEGRRRKLFLAASLAANVGVLVVFKYFNFLNANLKGLAEALRWNYPVESLAILLPIGLSFHTFQAMSYTIEVYRGAQPAERHFGIYALYVMFYPQLVAGPIERPQNLLHQFREVHRFDYERVASGLRLMAWGFFKKIVVADRLAVPVNLVYGEPEKHTGLALLVATYFFAYQIYCDFSGYTDIARGAARVMGFELMKNFDRPYAARSVAEFWTRWHISLSTWFKDYLFFPLARWHAARRARHAATGRAPAARRGRGLRVALLRHLRGLPRQRRLARGELDVRAVGRAARHVPRRVAGDQAAAGEGRAVDRPGAPAEAAQLRARLRRLPPRRLRLDLLPGRERRGRPPRRLEPAHRSEPARRAHRRDQHEARHAAHRSSRQRPARRAAGAGAIPARAPAREAAARGPPGVAALGLLLRARRGHPVPGRVPVESVHLLPVLRSGR